MINFRHKISCEQGFTLLEIIISTGILAIMAITMTGMTNNIINSRERAEKRNESRHGVGITLSKMSDDLRMAFQANKKFLGSDKFYLTGFDAESTNMNFSTMSNIHYIKNNRDTNQVQVGYSLVSNDKGNYDLVRRQTDFLTDDLKSGGRSFVLLKNVKDLRFSYYDSNKKDWQEKWDTSSVSSAGRLPQIVKVEITVYGEPDITDEDKLKEHFYELQVPIIMYKNKVNF